MIKNGGPGNLKQACVERRCIQPNTPTQDKSMASRPLLGINEDTTEDQQMELLSTILPTSTAQMMKLEDVATQCIMTSITMGVNSPTDRKSDLYSPSLCDSSVKTCEEDKRSNDTNKGFIKSLRRAERYVAEFDSSHPVRPKLSYGAMCALAIQVFRNASTNATYHFLKHRRHVPSIVYIFQ